LADPRAQQEASEAEHREAVLADRAEHREVALADREEFRAAVSEDREYREEVSGDRVCHPRHGEEEAADA
jgi:hypothetical protein